MEAFNCLIEHTIDGGFLSACRVGGREGQRVEVSHLLFADDTLIFCDASQDQVSYLCWLLMWFEALPGLKINLEKSELIPIESIPNIELLDVELGCKVDAFLLLTLVCLWVHVIGLWLPGIEWKNGSERGWVCGSVSTFLREEEPP